MKFSVAMPVYNGESYLQETLESLLDQALAPDEIVIVDDGSTDSTPDILSRYSPRISYTRIENIGCGAARKIAVEQCRNEWIALCDADDVWNREHLHRKSEICRLFPHANVLASNFISFSEAFTETPARLDAAPPDWVQKYTEKRTNDFVELASPYAALLDFNPIYPSGLAFNQTIYLAAGGINPVYSRWQAEDAEFIRRLLSLSNSHLVIDESVTWRYRRHPGNLSATHWKNLVARAKILQAHCDSGVTPDAHREKCMQTVALALGQAFDTAYWDGFFEEALNLYAQVPSGQRTFKRYLRKIISAARR